MPIKRGDLPRPPQVRRRHPFGDIQIVVQAAKSSCMEEYKITAGSGDQEKTPEVPTPKRSCPPVPDIFSFSSDYLNLGMWRTVCKGSKYLPGLKRSLSPRAVGGSSIIFLTNFDQIVGRC